MSLPPFPIQKKRLAMKTKAKRRFNKSAGFPHNVLALPPAACTAGPSLCGPGLVAWAVLLRGPLRFSSSLRTRPALGAAGWEAGPAMNEASDEGKTRGAWCWRAREPGHGEPGPAALRPASTRWYLAPAAARAVPGSTTSPAASPCFQEDSSRRLFFYLLDLYSGGVQVSKTAAGLSGQKKAQRFWKVGCYGCWPRSLLVPGHIYPPRYPRSVFFFSSTPK